MMSKKVICMLAVFAVGISPFAAPFAGPRGDARPADHVKQIVVRIHKSGKDREYEMRSYNLKKGDANYWLAEIKLRECSDCQIIPIIDDDVDFGSISQISEMAINAGFKDIRPFVYWRKTGRMAQIEFGPTIKYSDDPQKISDREKKEAASQHFTEIK